MTRRNCGPKRRYPIVPCRWCGSDWTKSGGHLFFGAWIRRKLICHQCPRCTLVIPNDVVEKKQNMPMKPSCTCNQIECPACCRRAVRQMERAGNAGAKRGCQCNRFGCYSCMNRRSRFCAPAEKKRANPIQQFPTFLTTGKRYEWDRTEPREVRA